MTAPERRAGVEFRIAGRTLTGTVLRYGDVSPEHRERFQPGAFAPVPDVPMRLQHDPAMQILPAGAFILNDTERALEIRAELPAGSAALDLTRRGACNGWSVAFHARAERREAGIRVIERAELVEVSLVDQPSYPASTAEVRRAASRARSGRKLRSRVPYDESLACECIARRGPGSGAECVPLARFAKSVGEAWQETFDILLGEVEDGTLGRDVLAVSKDYSRPLGSARRGTLRLADDQDGVYVEIDLPVGNAGDDVVAATETAGTIVRPLIDDERSVFTDGPEGREYERAHLRAFLVGSTDARAGWPDARITYEGDGERAAPDPAPRRRRFWL